MIKKYKISDNDYKVPQKRANKFKIFHKDYKVKKCAISQSKDGLIFPKHFLPNGPFTKTKPCSEKVIEVLMEERKPHKSGPQVDRASKLNFPINYMLTQNIEQVK